MRLGIAEAYESVKARIPNITLEQFDELTSEAEVTPLTYCGKCKGAMLNWGPEVHTCVTPPWYGRQALRVISNLVRKYGEVTTSATTDVGDRILRKMGFEIDGLVYRSNKIWE